MRLNLVATIPQSVQQAQAWFFHHVQLICVDYPLWIYTVACPSFMHSVRRSMCLIDTISFWGTVSSERAALSGEEDFTYLAYTLSFIELCFALLDPKDLRTQLIVETSIIVL